MKSQNMGPKGGMFSSGRGAPERKHPQSSGRFLILKYPLIFLKGPADREQKKRA